MPEAIAVQGLTHRRDDRLVVDHLQFSVQEGDRFALVGRVGAGKTALVRMLATVLEPSNGTALVAGADVREEPRVVRSRIGYVDEGARPARPDWRPWPYLKYWGRLQGLSLSNVREEAVGLLEQFVDPQHHGTAVGDLPLTARRRLDVARAFLHDPDVLLLDDPTRGWDLVEKQNLWRDLENVLRSRDTTLFLGTQDAEEAEALCERVGALAGARLAYEGSFEGVPGDGPLRARLARVLQAEPEAGT